MSSNEDESGSGGDSGPGTREIAHRLFAAEFDAASLQYADSDEERAPKYVITPSGARVNRLFVVGVLTEVERVNDEVVRARVVDPTGAFVVYAGQYQPDALAFLERADPPMFVAVTGKANTFQPEDSDRVYTSVRPESVAEVDAGTRDRWTVQAAEHTLRRVGEFATALEGGETDPTSGIALAREEYATTPAYLSALRDTALDAARLVAGEVEEVNPPGIDPGEDDGRAVDLTDLREGDARVSGPAGSGESGVDAGAEAAETADTSDTDEPSEPTASSESPSADPDVASGSDPVSESEPEPETEAETGTTAEPSIETGESGAAEAEAESEPREETASTEPSGSATDEASGTADTAETIDTTAAEPEGEPRSDSDELGDFDAGGSEPSDPEPEPEPEGEATVEADAGGEGEMYEFDPEERAEIESEFDMDFSSGNEVDDAGEADIDVPEPDDAADAEATEAETGSEPEPIDSAAGESEPETGSESEPDATDEAEDVDVEDRAMAVMGELADGDGADREAVIERVSNEAGVAPEEVDDAIEDALMSGRCYEPQDDVLKPI